MADVNIKLDLEKLPRALQKFQDQVPFAMSNSLNDIAFTVKRHVQSTGYDGQINIRSQVQSRRTTLVNKSTKNTLRAEVGSTAWYMENLATGGTRTARIGIKLDGKNYLLKPFKENVTKTGRVKKSLFNNKRIFAFTSKKGHRILAKGKGKKGITTIGLLETKFQYRKRLNIPKSVNPIIKRDWDKEVKKNLIRAARTAR